jgi:putative transcriptional regulator
LYTVVETPLFQRLADDYWTEDERSSFVSFIAGHPEAGIFRLMSCARSRRKLNMAKGAKKLRLAESGEELGEQLLQSVREMKAGLRGRVHTPEVSSIVEARLTSGLSQASFAALLGVSVRTLQDWEQGRREPSGAAKTLIKVAKLHPEVLQELAS